MKTFNIYVDLAEKGIDLELEVLPQGNSYLVKLDGIVLTVLEYVMNLIHSGDRSRVK